MNFSRIGLGTVEIGLPYGIKNSFLPTEPEAIHLLQYAVDLGIRYFDTARAYGLSEERIGKSKISKNESVLIGTKCAQFLKTDTNLDSKELEKRIRAEIEQSRENLQLDTLFLVQIHNEREDPISYAPLIEIFQKLKNEKKVAHVGVAVRGERAAISALEESFFESIQIAFNILDQRMSDRVFIKSAEKNIKIIQRSALLQGALSPARMTLPEPLQTLKLKADIAEKIAGRLGLDLPTLALRFSFSVPNIHTTLIGTTKTKNLKNAFKALEEGPLATEVLQELRELRIEDPNQIDPAHWPKLR